MQIEMARSQKRDLIINGGKIGIRKLKIFEQTKTNTGKQSIRLTKHRIKWTLAFEKKKPKMKTRGFSFTVHH